VCVAVQQHAAYLPLGPSAGLLGTWHETSMYVCMDELHCRIHIVDIDASRQLGSLRVATLLCEGYIARRIRARLCYVPCLS
jgi:hypothetical protein